MIKVAIQSKLAIQVVLMIIVICFAANSVITRYLVLGNFISPFALTIIRFVSGLIMLQILCSLMPRSFQRTKTEKSYILGAIFLGIYAFAISYGYSFISAAAGTLIFYIFVIMTMTLFSVINDKEKLTPVLIVGQLLGILGVLAITFSGIKSVTLLGAFLMAITGISWGLHSVYGRRFEKPFSYTYNSFLIFGVISLILFLTVHLLSNKPLLTNITTDNLGWALFMGTISTALSYALWHKVMKKIKASQGGMVQLLVPVIAVLMGVFLLGEELTLSLIIGGILILIGIFLNTFKNTNTETIKEISR